ncbi:4Fe-4S dicluster domain-containing protein [Ferrimonas lipolytica]|uniref:4Fe-4S binding protein n=1 Tax=Ferrimonas lipolytica TaxID=2724191 RepID=A0A6H1UDK7_9GAMM|nr:4Fe-4S dicluster domain-containing protein [Ferrimonas lipolytica]QIZ76296.1 4Fe-4S binding protein [Ferrimonas lipolytica]
MDNNEKYAFYFDSSKCTGCKGCHIACKDKNNLSEDVLLRRVYEYGGGGCTEGANNTLQSSVFVYYMSVGCNHCDKPVCVAACPTGACYKNSDGLVQIDQKLCIGCCACVRACPYDAPQFDNARQVTYKCDGCRDRLAMDKVPSCVSACTGRALDFGTTESLLEKYPNASDSSIAPLPASEITQPNLLITPNKSAKVSGSLEGQVLNETEV